MRNKLELYFEEHLAKESVFYQMRLIASLKKVNLNVISNLHYQMVKSKTSEVGCGFEKDKSRIGR